MPSVAPVQSPRIHAHRTPSPIPARRRTRGNTRQIPLSRQLFEAVAGMHHEVAGHAFFTALNAGTLPRAAYVAYLRDHLAICTALENGLRNQRAAVGDLGAMHFERRQAILQDLATLGEDTTPASAAATDLTRTINAATPNQLIVHAWTEYMAMLNGGQGMRPKLQKLFGTAQIVTFAEPVSQLRLQYTEALDFRKVSDSERTMMCEEAKRAFAAHKAMLDAEVVPPADAPPDANKAVSLRSIVIAMASAQKWIARTIFKT